MRYGRSVTMWDGGSARPVSGSLANRDEQTDHRFVDVGRVPGTWRIDGVVAGPELDALLCAVAMLLVKGHVPLKAADHFIAFRVHLPTRPRLIEPEERNEAPFRSIIAVTLIISV